MREIKFRGRDTQTGKYVCGAYLPFLNDESLPMIATAEGLVEIARESLEQLIAVDANGREVYENDPVINVTLGAEYRDAAFKADFADYVKILEGDVIYACD